MKQLEMIATVVMMAMMAACSKKDGPSNTNPGTKNNDAGIVLNAKEQYLVGSWSFEYSVDSQYSGTDLQYEQLEAAAQCSQDDRYIFKDNRTYTLSEGADTCSANRTYGPLPWSITDNDTTGYLSYEHGPDTWKIGGAFRKIDDNHFSVQAIFHQWPPYSTKITYYYKRQ
jgi:hypothetical protein